MTPPIEKPKRGLGRGLDALFADGEARIEERGETPPKPMSLPVNVTTPPVPVEKPEALSTMAPPPVQSGSRQLPISVLIPGPFQPRRKFDDNELGALSGSIRTHGILQPLLVRVSPNQTGRFEIIAGERRWRAAQLAQQHEVPVVIRELDDRAALEIGLIENVQRQDLTPIEEAEGYQRLIKEFDHTQEELGDVVGKSRAYITNALRLLTLPESVREKVHAGDLSAGHARALVGLENAALLADTAIAQKWSVRELERQVAHQKNPKAPSFGRMSMQEMNERRTAKNDKNSPFGPFPGIDHPMPKDGDVIALETEMSNVVGLKVDIQSMADGSGVVALYFSTLDQLDGLLQTLTRGAKH